MQNMIKYKNLAKVLGVAVLATGLSSTAMAQRISDFSLIGNDGKFHQVSRYANHDAMVLFVYDKDSEVVSDALRDFNRVMERFEEEEIAFFMLESTGIAD